MIPVVKKVYFALIFLFLTVELYADPLLVVVIMVKKQAPVICETLQPFIDAGVKDYLFYDTGSTDNTPEIAREHFKKHCIENAHIICEPFVDFSISRNRALDLADQKFPNATFFIMPDAEWYLQNGEGLIKFCEEHKEDPSPSYLMRVSNKSMSLKKLCLLRRDKHERFVGAVHEWLASTSQACVPEDIYLEYRPSNHGAKKSMNRTVRDRDLLIKDYEKNPKDPRTVFYLAQTYSCREEWMSAYKYYVERSKLKGYVEEDSMTFYRLGLLIEKIGEADKSFTWQMALDHYLTAYSRRPQRIEPLVMIANHYLNTGEPALAYLFIQRACATPYPVSESQPFESKIYNFDRFFIYARCAWELGDYASGEKAARLALEAEPEDAMMRDLWTKYIKSNQQKINEVPQQRH